MYQVHLHAELLVQMFRQVLCRVHGAVLSAGAAEADRQIGEAAFHVALHGSVDKGVGMLQEYGYLAVVFQEADNGFVQSREGFVTLVLAGVVHSAADDSAFWDHQYSHKITGGTLTKVVHNRKYMEKHPEIVDDFNKLENSDLHDWQLVGEVVEPTLEKDGYADYVCRIDKCGQTKRVVLPKLTPEPSEPDVPGDNTPNTPNKPDTPKQPDGTTPAPVTPDAPVQDSTVPADTLAADTTADAAVVPATAQNLVQDAKPEAAATAAVSAAVLPQTGANWLAVVGSALSGLFLLAAGFVLDRKNRRMN